MTPRQPVTTRRLAAVMAPAISACTVTALAVGPRYPFAALLFIAGILVLSSAALPGAAWSWCFRVAAAPVRAIRRQPEPDAAEHALWVDRLSIVAHLQKHAVPSHPHDCFCVCGIPRPDLERFRDQLELIAWEMELEEQQRRRGK